MLTGPRNRTRPIHWSNLLLLFCLAAHAQASVEPATPAGYHSHRITCDAPIRLTHDCSIWQGATRPIALGDYRMAMAADQSGQTILVTRMRLRPSHNGFVFEPSQVRRISRIIDAVRSSVAQQGITLKSVRPVRRGKRIIGYFMAFSANAYDHLKTFTVLDAKHLYPNVHALR